MTTHRPSHAMPLFDDPPHSGSLTSRQSARATEPRMSRTRRMVFDEITKRKMAGATDEEISDRTGLPENTVRPRRGELVKDLLVVNSGRVRLTSYKNKAIVWVAAEFET